MFEKVTDLLKTKPLYLPQLLLSNYKSLKLDEKELIVLIYLINYDGPFNPKYIAKEMNYELKELMLIIDSLTDKGIIKIEIIDKSVKEEIINLDQLYQKLSFLIINQKEEKSSNIYTIIEKEFGRTLSPMEYEIIKAWLEDYDEETIKLAVKEASFNGVSNLRYIDKILHEWQKKGIKNEQDIINDRKKHQSLKVTKKVMDYDWLNE